MQGKTACNGRAWAHSSRPVASLNLVTGFSRRISLEASTGKTPRRAVCALPSDVAEACHALRLFRSLDLTTEILENAGASVLCAGSYMAMDEVTSALAHFHVNVLSGDGSQIIRVVHHISTLPASQRKQIKLDKIIYTSEPLSPAQRAYITATLGKVKICSMLGSCEAGPWAIANPALTGDQEPGTMDFVFDTRTMLVEVLAPSALDGDAVQGGDPVPDEAPGIIVQTSLQRLRNPLIRYVSGDIGSLHPLHGAAAAVIPRDELEHLRVLRLHGRDARFSFKWFGSYFEFDKIVPFMQGEEWGILQWQVVLGSLESSPQTTLEVRIFRSSASDAAALEAALVVALEKLFFVEPENCHLFRVAFLKDLTGFERSSTGGKIMRFVDKSH